MARTPDAANPGAGSSSGRLDSWKEIAAYLICSVYACRGELDAWWESRRAGLAVRVPEIKDL
jgi:hypothetical protein